MKKTLILLAVLSSLTCSAQNFVPHFTIALPDSITSAETEWLDMNNSGLYDIVLFTTAASGKRYVQFITGDTVNIPVLSEKYIALEPYEGYLVHDYDNDNSSDFVFSFASGGTRKTVLFRNEGDFNFSRVDLTLPPFSFARCFDLDHNGVPECILSGEDDNGNYFTRTYHRAGSAWQLKADTLQVKLNSFQATDFNGDGFEDVFMSGAVRPDSTFSVVLEYKGSYYERKAGTKALATSFLADGNLDGVLDVVARGTLAGQSTLQFFTFENGYRVQSKPAVGLKSIFIAGIQPGTGTDTVRLTVVGADTTNIIAYGTGTMEVLPHRQLRSQKFGDLEHDGDLDLVQITGVDKLEVRVLKNKLQNGRPTKPLGVAVPLYNHVFMFWPEADDDHTPPQSLTYDIYLDGGVVNQDATFDLLTARRLAVQHGNNGTTKYRLLRNVDKTNFNFAIQAVDNAYHGGGLCTGSGTTCANVTKTPVEVCTDEVVRFTAGTTALWFSVTSGFLGEASALNYSTASADTVFSVSAPENGCVTLGLYEIKINDLPRVLTDKSRHTCAGKPVTLAVQTDWSSTWTSLKQGNLGTGSSVTFQTSADDVVTATYSNAEGCTIRQNFNVIISTPAVTVTPATSKILKGQSVKLVAAGAQSYSWSPAAGLSATNIPDPSASPVAETIYTVTGYDSIGCAANALATVYVEASGFAATLFSPNADGKNDRFRIYGVSGVEQFRLEVFNREGKRVYSTDKLDEAVNLGWDGTTNGADQPNGVYFWKVSGSTANGNKLLLNGKQEGSVVLIR